MQKRTQLIIISIYILDYGIFEHSMGLKLETRVHGSLAWKNDGRLIFKKYVSAPVRPVNCFIGYKPEVHRKLMWNRLLVLIKWKLKKVVNIFGWNIWKYLAVGQIVENLEKSKMHSFIIFAEYGHGFLN